MGFIQIIEYTTTRKDEMDSLFNEWDQQGGSADTPVRRIASTTDRDRPNTYLTIVEFDSYDEAMANSGRPETDEYAQKMISLCDSPPIFRNLDITEQRIPG